MPDFFQVTTYKFGARLAHASERKGVQDMAIEQERASYPVVSAVFGQQHLSRQLAPSGFSLRSPYLYVFHRIQPVT